jgi:hypothetical protein
MIRKQAGKALAAEGAQDHVGYRGHSLRRFGESEQRKAENITRKVQTQDLPRAVAEHGAGVQPSRLHDEEFAWRLILTDDDCPAPERANLILQPVERFPFAVGQAQMIAKPNGQTAPQTTPPAQIRKQR